MDLHITLPLPPFFFILVIFDLAFLRTCFPLVKIRTPRASFIQVSIKFKVSVQFFRCSSLTLLAPKFVPLFDMMQDFVISLMPKSCLVLHIKTSRCNRSHATSPYAKLTTRLSIPAVNVIYLDYFYFIFGPQFDVSLNLLILKTINACQSYH